MNKYQLRRLPLTIAVSSTLAAGSLQAATITVDSTSDGPIGTFPGVCTLRSAIAAANTNVAVDGCASGDTGADLIAFDAALTGSTVVLSSQITISESVSITGPVPDDASGVTIDGNLASRHFSMPGTPANSLDVSLNGLVLTGGRAQGSGGAILATSTRLDLSHVELLNNSAQYIPGGFENRGNGGAVALSVGALTLSDAVVSSNFADGLRGGGGLYVYEPSVVSVTDSTISSNVAELGYGGGLAVVTRSATAYEDRTMQITGSTIDNNTAGGSGGGVSLATISGIESLDLMTITDSSISGNTARRNGGGLNVTTNLYDTDIRLERVEISGNRIQGLDGAGFAVRGGAGVYADYFSTFSLIDSKIQNNLAVAGTGLDRFDLSGGGLNLLRCFGGMEIRDSVISSNSIVADQSRGGGLASGCRGDIVSSEISANLLQLRPHPDGLLAGAGIYSYAPIDITNSSIVSNQLGYLTVDQAGTAAGLDLAFGSSISHSTIVGNRVTYGAVTASSLGVFNIFGTPDPDPVTLVNTIISGPADADACINSQYLNDLGGNLVTDATCTGAATDPVDLALGPLDDNGGPTRTIALGAGSVAIDAAGDCRTKVGIETDQRGVARGRLCDVGAFEVFEDVILSDRFESSQP